MTDRQEELVHRLRLSLFEHNYPNTFKVDEETLEAATLSMIEWQMRQGYEPVVKYGPNGGPYFKGVELLVGE